MMNTIKYMDNALNKALKDSPRVHTHLNSEVLTGD